MNLIPALKPFAALILLAALYSPSHAQEFDPIDEGLACIGLRQSTYENEKLVKEEDLAKKSVKEDLEIEVGFVVRRSRGSSVEVARAYASEFSVFKLKSESTEGSTYEFVDTLMEEFGFTLTETLVLSPGRISFTLTESVEPKAGVEAKATSLVTSGLCMPLSVLND